MSEHAASTEPAQHTTTIEIPGNGQVNAGFEDTESVPPVNGYPAPGQPTNGMPVPAANGLPMHGAQTPPPPRETAHMNGETPHMNGEAKTNGVEMKTPGSEETKELTEAVNLELVNMQPYSNSIPIKKESTELDIGDPYDEYFVPVNQHKKYMRGEKLYVTQDKRRSLGGSKKKCCWSVLTLVVLGGIVAILLGVILTSQENNNIEESRNFNGRSSSIGGGLFPTQKTTTNEPSRTTTEQADTFVKRVLQGELTIANSGFTPGLANKSSSEFKNLAASFEEELKNALFNHQTLHYGASDITVKVLEFRPGSIVVTYRVGWIFKEGIQNPPDPIDKEGLKSKLLEHLRSKDGFLYNYKLPLHSLKVERVRDECSIDNGGCSQNCLFNVTSLQFACSCDDFYILNEDGKTCIKQEISSVQPDQSFDSDSEKDLSIIGNEGDSSSEEPIPEPAPASEEPSLEPAVSSEEPAPEPVAPSEEPAPEPVPPSEEPAPEPVPSSEEPVPEPAPSSEEPVPEPAPSSEEPVPEPGPSSEEEPAPEPAPSSEEPVPEPASSSEEPAPEPVPPSEEPAPEPVPPSEEPAPEPAPSSEEPAREPAPSSEEPVPEPAPSSEEPIPEPALSSEEPIPEPAPSSEEPFPEPAPSSEEPAPKPDPSSEKPAPEPALSSEEPALAPATSSEEPAPEPAPSEEPAPEEHIPRTVFTSEEHAPIMSTSEEPALPPVSEEHAPPPVSEEHAPVTVYTSQEPSTASEEHILPESSPALHEPTSFIEHLSEPVSDFASSMTVPETTPALEEPLPEHSFERLVEQTSTIDNNFSDNANANGLESSTSSLSEIQPPLNLTIAPDNLSTNLHASNTIIEMSSTETVLSTEPSSSKTTIMNLTDSSSSSESMENSRDPKDISAETLFSDNSTTHFEKFINPPVQEVAETTATFDLSSSTENMTTKDMEEASNDDKEKPSKTIISEIMLSSTEIESDELSTTTEFMKPEQITLMYELPSELSSEGYLDKHILTSLKSNDNGGEVTNTSPNALDNTLPNNNASASMDSDNGSFTTTMNSFETMQPVSTYYFQSSPIPNSNFENISPKTDSSTESILEQTAKVLLPEETSSEINTTQVPQMMSSPESGESNSDKMTELPSARTEKSNFSIWKMLGPDTPTDINEEIERQTDAVVKPYKEEIQVATTALFESQTSPIPTHETIVREELEKEGHLPQYTTEMYLPSTETSELNDSKEMISSTELTLVGGLSVQKLNISEHFTEQSEPQVDQSEGLPNRLTETPNDNVSIDRSKSQIINSSLEFTNQNNVTDTMLPETPKPPVLIRSDDMPMIALTHIPELSGPYSVDSTIPPIVDIDDMEPIKVTETGEPSIEDSVNEEGNSKDWYDSKNSLEDDYNDENSKKYYKTTKGKHFKSFKTEETNVPHDSDAVEQNFSQLTEKAPEVTESSSLSEKVSVQDTSVNPPRPVESSVTVTTKINEEEELAIGEAFITSTPMNMEDTTLIPTEIPVEQMAEGLEKRTNSDTAKDAMPAVIISTTKPSQIFITTSEAKENATNSSTTQTVNQETKSMITARSDTEEVTTIINSTDNETSSQGMCATGEFACADGNGCLALSQHCDRITDCSDHSDEINCPSVGCSSTDFQCKNGDCISKEFVCDSIKQCMDGTDEDSCSTTTSPVVTVNEDVTTDAILTTNID